jgi:hypothetical protein
MGSFRDAERDGRTDGRIHELRTHICVFVDTLDRFPTNRGSYVKIHLKCLDFLRWEFSVCDVRGKEILITDTHHRRTDTWH